MTTFITINNSGEEVTDTNYWDLDSAKKGLFYLSWNAGAARLLVPEKQKSLIADMLTAEFVIISHGKWQNRDALELLFEDNTDTPFSIHLVTDQCDRLIPETDQGGGFDVVIWTQKGKQGSFPGKYRVVDALPCLQPWVEQ